MTAAARCGFVGGAAVVATAAALWLAAARPALPAAHIDNSCVFAMDDVCDEPRYGGTGRCPDGTDFADCSRFGRSCPWVRNGDCDERVPWGIGRCASGTDAMDCANANPGPDSCQYAGDGTCDHPGGGTGLCPPNTDISDCLAAQRAAATATPESDALVAPIQAELTTLGYEPGPIDGVLGATTRRAIERFQGDQGLPVTGEASQALLEALRRQSTIADAPVYVPTRVRPRVNEAPFYQPEPVRPRADGTALDASDPTEPAGAPRPVVPRPTAEEGVQQTDVESPGPPVTAGPGNDRTMPREAPADGGLAAGLSDLQDDLARLQQDIQAFRAKLEVLELRREIAELRSQSAELRQELDQSAALDAAADDADEAVADPSVAAEIARLRAAIAERDRAIAALQSAMEAVTVVE